MLHARQGQGVCFSNGADVGLHFAGALSRRRAGSGLCTDAAFAHPCRYARTRQILNWAFAAAPGHPALKEVCDRIASSMRRTFSADTHLDTLERTGPGAFTDVVLKHADMHAPHQVRAQ